MAEVSPSKLPPGEVAREQMLQEWEARLQQREAELQALEGSKTVNGMPPPSTAVRVAAEAVPPGTNEGGRRGEESCKGAQKKPCNFISI